MSDAAVLHEPLFWVLGILAVMIVGLAKGGFVGLGALPTPLFALAVPPMQAAAILLPLLLVQDAVSIWSFRKTWNAHVLKVMLPGGVIGIGLAYLFAASVPDRWVLGALGMISIVFGLQRLWIQRGGRIAPVTIWPNWAGFLCGIGSGAASQIAHAGGPPFQIWVMPQRLHRDILVGTSSIFFGVLNWIKLPTYAALGEFTLPNLMGSLVLLPIATASTFAGVWIVRRIDPTRFYAIAYSVLVLVGVKLTWNAFI